MRKEKALIQTTLDEMRVKHKRDVEVLKENLRKSHSEMDAAQKLHDREILVMKESVQPKHLFLNIYLIDLLFFILENFRPLLHQRSFLDFLELFHQDFVVVVASMEVSP